MRAAKRRAGGATVRGAVAVMRRVVPRSRPLQGGIHDTRISRAVTFLGSEGEPSNPSPRRTRPAAALAPEIVAQRGGPVR
jgi:hypothetical protein